MHCGEFRKISHIDFEKMFPAILPFFFLKVSQIENSLLVKIVKFRSHIDSSVKEIENGIPRAKNRSFTQFL